MARSLLTPINYSDDSLIKLKRVASLGSRETSLRCTAIQMLLTGADRQLVTDSLLITDRVLRNWINIFNQYGVDGLIVNKRLGRRSTLTPHEIKKLELMLLQGATFHGWINNMWNSKRVAIIIYRYFGKKISRSTVCRILKNKLGWTYQMPIHKYGDRDEAEINNWKSNKFNRIRLEAITKGAHLVFIDETGFMLEPVRRRTYAPKGKPPSSKITNPHGRISTICAITCCPKRKETNLIFHLLQDNVNFNSQRIINFLFQLRQCIIAPLIIIWDSIPIHCSAAVLEYLEKRPEITSEKFPPYAPELNPVDKVWAYIKYTKLGNYAPKDLNELRKSVDFELTRLKRKANMLRAFIRGCGLNLH